jgi:hypothetical protein
MGPTRRQISQMKTYQPIHGISTSEAGIINEKTGQFADKRDCQNLSDSRNSNQVRWKTDAQRTNLPWKTAEALQNPDGTGANP